MLYLLHFVNIFSVKSIARYFPCIKHQHRRALFVNGQVSSADPYSLLMIALFRVSVVIQIIVGFGILFCRCIFIPFNSTKHTYTHDIIDVTNISVILKILIFIYNCGITYYWIASCYNKSETVLISAFHRAIPIQCDLQNAASNLLCTNCFILTGSHTCVLYFQSSQPLIFA